MSTPVHQLSPQQKLFSQNGGITIMNVLLINGSPHAHGCTDAALQEIAKALNISGPFNIKYLAKDNDIKEIE